MDLLALLRVLARAVGLHGQAVLFLALAFEEAGLPLPAPGDVLVVFYAARHRDEPATLLATLALAVLASTLGAPVPYGVSWRIGPLILDRLGRWLHLEERNLERGRRVLREHGVVGVAVLRVIPGFRLPIAVLAGTAHVPPAAYVPAVMAAAVVYWGFWIFVGVTFGGAVAAALARVRFPLLFVVPVVLLVVAAAAIFVAVRRRRA